MIEERGTVGTRVTKEEAGVVRLRVGMCRGSQPVVGAAQRSRRKHEA